MALAPHIYYSSTKSLCVVCRAAVEGKIVIRGDAVHLLKFCPDHGQQECLLASSAAWYLDCLNFISPATPPAHVGRAVTRGCPFDCGACPSHQQRMFLPVIPITSACNLDCPLCYTINRNESPYRMTGEEMRQILDRMFAGGHEVDIVNFTGGEPTLHPELPAFLAMCRDAGIRRLTVSTNGLRLLDEGYAAELAALETRIILSLDTFRPETDRILTGANTVQAKLKVLDILDRHGASVTILPAIAAGFNDDELGALLDLMLRGRSVCSLELHTMCFTGQGGTAFSRRGRITIPDVHRRLEEATGGRIRSSDFVPSPLAHPHCYSICYLLRLADGGYVPFTRFLSRARLFELLQDSLYLEPCDKVEEAFRDVVDDLWAQREPLPEAEQVLRTLKKLINDVFPPGRPLPMAERQRISERVVKAIYIHSHMDEESFDVSRLMKCCVAVPNSDGTTIPTCSYNVLYREKDQRFATPGRIARMSEDRRRLVRPAATA